MADLQTLNFTWPPGVSVGWQLNAQRETQLRRSAYSSGHENPWHISRANALDRRLRANITANLETAAHAAFGEETKVSAVVVTHLIRNLRAGVKSDSVQIHRLRLTGSSQYGRALTPVLMSRPEVYDHLRKRREGVGAITR